MFAVVVSTRLYKVATYKIDHEENVFKTHFAEAMLVINHDIVQTFELLLENHRSK